MDQNNELKLEFHNAERPVEVHTARSWRGLSVQFSRLQLPTEYEFKWEGGSHYLAYHDLVLIDGEMQVLGEKPIAGGDLRDQMTFVPASHTIDGWAKPANRLNAFTTVCFDPAKMEEELQIEFNGMDPQPNIYFKEAELGATMRKLGRILSDSESPASNLYVEAIGMTAALEMLKLSQTRTNEVKARGGLTKSQARMVLGYIEENLARDISLDDLAHLCGLTRFHFSRAFKTSFGEPPHKYLTVRRLERAKQLLAGTRMPVADVASACGFNGASQLARSFRDLAGQTPLAFRRNA